VDPGLAALVMMLQYQGVAADAAQIRHRVGAQAVSVADILLCAKQYGVKARALSSDWTRLAKTPMPALAVLKDGGFLLLGKVADDKILVQGPLEPRPRLLKREELKEIWGGRLLLMTKRGSLTDLSRRFDITWFLGALHKYRARLGEVLIASFFLQLFGLVSPLFFQVVIDKVLVHRSLSTLDILVIGLVTITVFETVLGILRTYVFSHTTNRIDVELGARLFRHLLALPIGYFQARRVGDSVARVRELENIRTFLTGSALTLVIDLFFTLVFVVVMFLYSPLLASIVVGSIPFYLLISVAATPLFRERVQEKFKRGAENQAFLVESVAGIETLKAMAVEPQMQRRWEEQLASYVTSSFKVISLGNTASNLVQLVNKLAMAAILYFGAKLVIENSLSVGELVAFNIFAGRVSQPVLRLAQIWQDFHQARLSVDRLGDILNTTAEPTYNPQRTSLPAIRGDLTFVATFAESQAQTVAEYRRSLSEELGKATQKENELTETLVRAEKKAKLQSLRSPVDGTVQQLAIHTVGGVVTPSQELMVVVPAGTKIEVDANIPNRDIGFIQVGQTAEIKIDAFNFTKYGFIDGRVLSVSQDSIRRQKPVDPSKAKFAGAQTDSSEPLGQEMVYQARIALDQSDISVDGKRVQLSPGMVVTAEIKTGSRTVLSYLLSPVLRLEKDSLHER